MNAMVPGGNWIERIAFGDLRPNHEVALRHSGLRAKDYRAKTPSPLALKKR